MEMEKGEHIKYEPDSTSQMEKENERDRERKRARKKCLQHSEEECKKLRRAKRRERGI